LLRAAFRHPLPGVHKAFNRTESGMLFFTAVMKHASTNGVDEQLGTDCYWTKDGGNLYFYGKDSIQEAFGGFGLIEATEIDEAGNGKSATRLWKVVCKKTEV
jgi:hypothetical protein